MNELTTSERLFEQFCATHSINCERISATTDRTPDYEIRLGEQRIIIEVKQIDPNQKEQCEIEQFNRDGFIVGGKGAPGDRMRRVIADANGQLERTKGEFPSMVVVYDNVPFAFHTCSYEIRAAMYGLQQLDLRVSRGSNLPLRCVGVSFGGKRKMTPTNSTSTSALAIMKGHDPTEYRLDIYHNIFASVPLNVAVFTGLPVHQYTLQSRDMHQFQNWIKIENPRSPEK